MELFQVFGVSQLPTGGKADELYDRLGERLASPEYSANGILKRFHVSYQSPVASPLEDLSDFGAAAAPSFRGDQLLAPTEELRAGLAEKTGRTQFWQAVCALLDRFHAAGCRFADHSLDDGFFRTDADGTQTETLVKLGAEYARRGWTLLLHLGAKRRTSPRLARLAGPAGGYAASGSSFPTAAVCDLLGRMEEAGGLPDTVLFPLNMSDQASLATLQGSFSQDGVASKVQLGPAWWWCDHAHGVRDVLEKNAAYGVLSTFVGMTTDSRSLLSLARHDWFRRVLCRWVADKVAAGDFPDDPALLRPLVENICYRNAKRIFA
jgi:glucuronate isomerase